MGLGKKKVLWWTYHGDLQLFHQCLDSAWEHLIPTDQLTSQLLTNAQLAVFIGLCPLYGKMPFCHSVLVAFQACLVNHLRLCFSSWHGSDNCLTPQDSTWMVSLNNHKWHLLFSIHFSLKKRQWVVIYTHIGSLLFNSSSWWRVLSAATQWKMPFSMFTLALACSLT